MDRPYPSLLKAVVTAIAVCFSICGHADPSSGPTSKARSRDQHRQIQQRCRSARTRRCADRFGKRVPQSKSVRTSRSGLCRAVRSAEQHGGRETQRVLAPLTSWSRSPEPAIIRRPVPLLRQRSQSTRASLECSTCASRASSRRWLAASLRSVVSRSAGLPWSTGARSGERYGEGNPRVIPWLCDLGNWFVDISRTPEARMTFQVALNIVGTTDS